MLIGSLSDFCKRRSVREGDSLRRVPDLRLAGSGSLNDVVPDWVESSKMVPFRVPTLQHVLQWLALLFDAHITSFHKQAGSVEVHSCSCSDHTVASCWRVFVLGLLVYVLQAIKH